MTQSPPPESPIDPRPSSAPERTYLHLEGVSLRRIKTGLSLVQRPGVDLVAEIKRRFTAEAPEQVDVFVTDRRVIFGGKTYATANISSVSIEEAAKNLGCSLILLALGGLAILCNVVTNIVVGMASMGFGGSDSSGQWIFVGLVLIGIGVALYMAAKPSFAVYINSNSGEVDGFMAHEKPNIAKIHDAIQEALVDTHH